MRNIFNRQEEEIFCFENLAVLSKGNLIQNTLHTSYFCETSIKHAIWCKFEIENTRIYESSEKEKLSLVDCICLLDSHVLKVYTEFGENYVSNFQFKVKI